MAPEGAAEVNKVTLGTFKATPKMYTLVNQVLDTGRLSYGPLCGEFEARFALQHECKYGILANSGTSALQAALQAMKELYGWQDGDEVIVPALTFVATVNIVYHCGLQPVLADICPDDYSINPFEVELKVTDRTRCIIPVHPFGQPARMKEICTLGHLYSLKVIEDACEAMFVACDGKSVGAWGDAAAFSMYVAHLITTGIGGLITTSDEDLGLRIRSLVNHGIDVQGLPTAAHYDPTHLGRIFRFTARGHSFRVSELEAAIGLPQLDDWWQMIDKRQENAAYLSGGLYSLNDHLQLPTVRDNADHAFMVYPIVMRHEPKTDIMRHLAEHGIEVRDMLPLTTQPCYDFDPEDYPVANWVNQNGFYCGVHQDLDKSNLDYLLEVIHGYFK